MPLPDVSLIQDLGRIGIGFGIGIDADTLLPYDQTTTLMQNMADLIYDSYLYQDPDGKLHPRLATGYEVSPDGLTYTIKLRKGVKFSDGTDFNADAAKAAAEAAECIGRRCR